MKLLPRLSAVAILSLVIAWALSYLPGIQQRSIGPNGDMTVFQELKPVSLSEDNLVDWVLEMPIKLELEKVDWSHRILGLDFTMNAQTNVPDDVFTQLLDATVQGLVGTMNVERVQIRIFHPARETSGKERLLVALDAQRGQFKESDYEKWREKKLSSEAWLQGSFQFTQTSLWKQLKAEGNAK